jgi:hypothetical protein
MKAGSGGAWVGRSEAATAAEIQGAARCGAAEPEMSRNREKKAGALNFFVI